MPTWKEVTEANPDHSENFAARWKNFRKQGRDIDGEARLCDVISPRGGRIFDVGCGTGRIGGVLIERGHDVWGVDIDPILIDHARTDFPDGHWQVGDLCAGDRPEGEFDVAICGGNVFWFIAEDGRVPALRTIHDSLKTDGRAIIGYGAGRGYAFEDFFTDCGAAGLEIIHKYSTWDLKPFFDYSEYLVVVVQRAESPVIEGGPQQDGHSHLDSLVRNAVRAARSE